MTQERIVALDASGRVVWFETCRSESWQNFKPDEGPLYFIDGNWIMLPGDLDRIGNTEGRIVDDETALSWLIRNDYNLPPQIMEFARERQI